VFFVDVTLVIVQRVGAKTADRRFLFISLRWLPSAMTRLVRNFHRTLISGT